MLSYAPMIFQQVGFHSDTAAVFATVGLGVVKVTVAVNIEIAHKYSLMFIYGSSGRLLGMEYIKYRVGQKVSPY